MGNGPGGTKGGESRQDQHSDYATHSEEYGGASDEARFIQHIHDNNEEWKDRINNWIAETGDSDDNGLTNGDRTLFETEGIHATQASFIEVPLTPPAEAGSGDDELSPTQACLPCGRLIRGEDDDGLENDEGRTSVLGTTAGMREEKNIEMGVQKLPEDYERLDVRPRDGQCIFEALAQAIAHALDHEPYMAQQTRGAIVQYMKSSETLPLMWDMKTVDGRKSDDWNGYLEQIRKRQSKGGTLEIRAASMRWNVKIIVLNAKGSDKGWVFNDHVDSGERTTVVLLYDSDGEGHFDWLKPTTEKPAVISGLDRPPTTGLRGGGRKRAECSSFSFASSDTAFTLLIEKTRESIIQHWAYRTDDGESTRRLRHVQHAHRHKIHWDRKNGLLIGILMYLEVPELEHRKRGKMCHWACPGGEKGISQKVDKEQSIHASRLARRRHLRTGHDYSTTQLMQEEVKSVPRITATRLAACAGALAENWHRRQDAGHKQPRYNIGPIVQLQHKKGKKVKMEVKMAQTWFCEQPTTSKELSANSKRIETLQNYQEKMGLANFTTTTRQKAEEVRRAALKVGLEQQTLPPLRHRKFQNGTSSTK